MKTTCKIFIVYSCIIIIELIITGKEIDCFIISIILYINLLMDKAPSGFHELHEVPSCL